MVDSTHVPVLLNEAMAYLNPQSGKRYVDGTVGAAGHTQAILAASTPDGLVLGLDRDPRVITTLGPLVARFGRRLRLVNASYDELSDVLQEVGWTTVDGILLDLGFSSTQLDDPDRGFGFRHDGPLDLRFDQSHGQSAADYLRHASEKLLADALYRYGELYNSRGLARKLREVGHRRPIETTADLRRASGLTQPRHLAQLFQALRIAVNDELGILGRGLASAWRCLAPDGRLVVISFHSLEDRIVKQGFRSFAESAEGTVLTKKPIAATADEQKSNPRARSAKLRAIEKKVRRVRGVSDRLG